VIFERSAHCIPVEEANPFCALLSEFTAEANTKPT